MRWSSTTRVGAEHRRQRDAARSSRAIEAVIRPAVSRGHEPGGVPVRWLLILPSLFIVTSARGDEDPDAVRLIGKLEAKVGLAKAVKVAYQVESKRGKVQGVILL